ncbi:uroporphyrinogen decarboxylase [Chelativorans sp. YIM 93263]|uniref:uroporphyrinogen decarboxylase n=1 Tax=Chelativorans sp. YIM 93263 TaxID=2906648 RepID=UPI002378F7F9|nr:uroporphyrinogen decarboxylase [Chelativorans sp. YIM 93263]
MPQRKLLDVLNGLKTSPPPIWLMRQAGRYLPEYRETRRKAGSFLDLCFNPDLATEVTLQPIRRFDFDAAILFSDILVIPYALGRNLRFQEGIGPVMTPLQADDIEALETGDLHKHLNPVYETIRRLRAELPKEKALIGFCGAPWTVATYMIAGRGTPDQAPARFFGHTEPQGFEKLLQTITACSAEYLIRQIEAGADAVQIFDSWAGVLDEKSFEAWCVRPVTEIVRRVREKYPEVPIIGFPKGAARHYDGYRTRTGVTALGLDWMVPMIDARRLQAEGPVQGNLDPMRLRAGGEALEVGIDTILDGLGSGPLIFNLGHGITPDTPVEHVHTMVRRIRERG